MKKRKKLLNSDSFSDLEYLMGCSLKIKISFLVYALLLDY